ncbi:hypothetical protein [Neoaquamicrobium sediminum]|uniref:hypothetical protein n=1 Tax=Neoaquamicrobium sediminum TaxID=1849104 RepID=UPI001563450A|nr:hypothetical protein [Mesorhizobium sediminum]NRC54816.1 hypothetical protein [Mesorhizobium sediminum]
MKVEGTRFARGGRRAVIAALASTLLASCSATSGNEETFFGFNPSDQSALTAQAADDFAGATFTSDQTASAAEAFVMDENDPSLPDAVGAAPTIAPAPKPRL